MYYHNNFTRYPLFTPLICGGIDKDLYNDDGECWHKGTGLLSPFVHGPTPSYYCASTYMFDFHPDQEEVTKIVRDHGYGCPSSGLLRIPTPSLVFLARYFYYGPHGWNARIYFHGLEINVDPEMLLPLDTPRNFGWEEFKKAHDAFAEPNWVRSIHGN